MTGSYTIQSIPKTKQSDYTPRGGDEEFIYAREREVIAEGPSETGKTLAACWKIHLLCSKYPGLQGAIVRKTFHSVHGSVVQTFNRVIAGAPVRPYGGSRVERYIYPNKSVVWIGGMDNSDKVLSSERDFIYVNQAEELTLDDWEKLTTRTTGRAGVLAYAQTFGDCNPARQNHWIRTRAEEGKLRLIKTTHLDNPTLYDDAGRLTERGKRTMATLDALTGVRYKRLRLGLWATTEGAVFDTFDGTVGGPHVFVRDPADMVRWYLAMDEGYTNPAVILLVGADPDDRWHVFKEFYKSGVLQSGVVAQAKEWFDNAFTPPQTDEQKKKKEPAVPLRCSLAAVDSAAAGLIADLVNHGVFAVAAKGRVLDGIQKLQDRLKIQKDKRSRLSFDPSCRSTINDFESMVWKLTKDQPRDEPVKENDHGPDALRYLEDAILEGSPQIFL